LFGVCKLNYFTNFLGQPKIILITKKYDIPRYILERPIEVTHMSRAIGIIQNLYFKWSIFRKIRE